MEINIAPTDLSEDCQFTLSDEEIDQLRTHIVGLSERHETSLIPLMILRVYINCLNGSYKKTWTYSGGNLRYLVSVMNYFKMPIPEIPFKLLEINID